MFTGLIEEIGNVLSVQRYNNASRLMIHCSKVLENIKVGDSISTNGVCLTAVEVNSNSFVADVMPETMDKSNLSLFRVNDKVNLERAMVLGSRIGGHLVSGHIDGMGEIIQKKIIDRATLIDIKADDSLLKYMIEKGSIAIDGISLTIVSVSDYYFTVSIIPLTSNETTLTLRNTGFKVNLEVDMISKYVERLLGFSKKKSNVNLEFLAEHGFL